MSRSFALAEAIRDILNTVDFSVEFTATRAYCPYYTLKELKTLRVTVLTPIVNQSTISRVGNIDIITVDIVIQKQTSPTDHDAIDVLADLTEEIAEHFRGTRCKKWVWLETKIIVPYDIDNLSDWQVFVSTIRMQYQIAWK